MKRSVIFMAVAVIFSGVALVGCQDKKIDQQANANVNDGNKTTVEKMPPPVVDVETVKFESVPQVKIFSGRTAAFQTADVRPQVSGIIDEVMFAEGSAVQSGQPLYRINRDNYTASIISGRAAIAQAQANLSTAKANLASQQAVLAQAKADLQRLEGLLELDAISHQQYDQAITKVRTTEAAVGSAHASVEQAKAGIETAKANLSANELNLSRTIVKAPISGISSRSEVTAGALVNANQAQPLVTISRINPIYVDINQSSSDMLKLRQQLADGTAQAGLNSVELVLEDGSTYPMRGQLALTEAKVDEKTGAVTLRAIFPNDNYTLLPGMYVTARLVQTVLNNAVLLPQSAITRTPKGDTLVYVVDVNNKAQIRPVKVNGTYEGKWVVTDGLKAGEVVVVNGGIKIKPDQEVEVVVKPTPMMIMPREPHKSMISNEPISHIDDTLDDVDNRQKTSSENQSSQE